MNKITRILMRIKAIIEDIPQGEFFLINGPVFLGIIIVFSIAIILGPIFKGYDNVPPIINEILITFVLLPSFMIGMFFAIKKRKLPGAGIVHLEGWPAVVGASVLLLMCLIAEIQLIRYFISPF